MNEKQVSEIVEQAISARDRHWEEWLQRFSIALHRELGEIKTRVEETAAEVSVLVESNRQAAEVLRQIKRPRVRKVV